MDGLTQTIPLLTLSTQPKSQSQQLSLSNVVHNQTEQTVVPEETDTGIDQELDDKSNGAILLRSNNGTWKTIVKTIDVIFSQSYVFTTRPVKLDG